MSRKGRLKVCHVLYAMRPVYTGAGEQAIKLAQALQDQNVHSELLTANLTGAPALETIEGTPVRRLPIISRGAAREKEFAFKVVPFAWRRRYDVWHFHGANWSAYLAALLPRRLRPPMLVKLTLMGVDDPLAIQAQKTGSFKFRALTRSDALVSISQQLTECLRAQSRGHCQVVAMSNGVDTDVFKPVHPEQKAPLRLSLGLPAEGWLIGFLGQVARRKGVDLLLDAFKPLAERYPVHLCLVGPSFDEGLWTEPDFGQELGRRLSTPELKSRVILTGKVDNPWEYLQAMDVFVLPSRAEGQPNVLLEAMACGLPCVAMAAGWEKGIVKHRQNGIVFPYEDTNALSAALESVLRDQELRECLGRFALETVQEKYAMHQVAARYADLYHQLLSDSRTTP